MYVNPHEVTNPISSAVQNKSDGHVDKGKEEENSDKGGHLRVKTRCKKELRASALCVKDICFHELGLEFVKGFS